MMYCWSNSHPLQCWRILFSASLWHKARGICEIFHYIHLSRVAWNLLCRCWRLRIIIFQIFTSLCGWKHLEMCAINFSRMSRNWNIVVSNLNHSLFTYLPLQYVLLSSFLNRWLKLRTISISVEHSPVFGGQYFLIGLFFFLSPSVETLSACCFLSLPALFGVHDSPPKQPPVFPFHVRPKV